MVSVITITYNRAHLIGETIQSVLAQTYTDIEYIIVDDGSEDSTRQVVSGFNDERIKYHQLPRNGNLNQVRNYGLSQATGTYIAFVDSDDLWHPDKLQLQVKLMKENANLGFTFTEAQIFNKEKIIFKNIYNVKYKGDYSSGFFIPLVTDVQFFIFPSTIMILKECLQTTGLLDENLMCADKDLYAQLALNFEGRLLPEVLVRMRRHDSNISNHTDYHTQKILEDEIITLNKFHKEGSLNKRLLRKMSAVFYYKQGEFFYHQGKYGESRIRYSKSLLNNPFKPKTLVKYMLSALGIKLT